MGVAGKLGQTLANDNKRDERIATLEKQLQESNDRYNKLFITRTGGGTTTQYKIDKQGNRVGPIKKIPTRKSSGSSRASKMKQGTSTNLG